MNGPLSQPPVTPRVPPPRLSHVRAHPLLAPLAEQLDKVGARLGTPNEQPGDQDLAQQLGHQLRNLICAVTLLQDLRQGDSPSSRRELIVMDAPRPAAAFV